MCLRDPYASLGKADVPDGVARCKRFFCAVETVMGRGLMVASFTVSNYVISACNRVIVRTVVKGR
jgi:hypothetical protein